MSAVASHDGQPRTKSGLRGLWVRLKQFTAAIVERITTKRSVPVYTGLVIGVTIAAIGIPLLFVPLIQIQIVGSVLTALAIYQLFQTVRISTKDLSQHESPSTSEELTEEIRRMAGPKDIWLFKE